jgi:predicted nuclease of predicted toxin-antitoxin system
MKLPFDESRSPRLVQLLRDLFPESESALRNGLARAGDRRILDYAATHDFILVSTDSDFERLLKQVPDAKVVILRSRDSRSYQKKVGAGGLAWVELRVPMIRGSVHLAGIQHHLTERAFPRQIRPRAHRASFRHLLHASRAGIVIPTRSSA